MKFTVFGATGFIGSHLCRHLRGQGHEVYTPARVDEAALDRPLGHTVYCIGKTANYRDDAGATVEAHVGLFARILGAARFDSLLYLSSTRLYDSCAGECGEDRALMLNPGEPRHLFDLSKALGEALCHASGRREVRIARLASVYSDALESANFLHGLVKSALRGKTVKVGAPANAARDYIHCDDVCRVLEAIALRGMRPVYNVASGENVTNERLFALLSELCGVTIEGEPPDPGLSFPAIRIAAIAEDFGIRPESLESRLRRMIPAAPARRRVGGRP